MYTPIATKKQVEYLQHLTDRAHNLKMRHPSLIPDGLVHIVWSDTPMTSEKASLRIKMYQSILEKADLVLYPKKSVIVEDLPEC